MKSAKGNKRDYWLKDKVIEYVKNALVNVDMGYVDGFDMGTSLADSKKYVINIFCVVSSEKRKQTRLYQKKYYNAL